MEEKAQTPGEMAERAQRLGVLGDKAQTPVQRSRVRPDRTNGVRPDRDLERQALLSNERTDVVMQRLPSVSARQDNKDLQTKAKRTSNSRQTVHICSPPLTFLHEGKSMITCEVCHHFIDVSDKEEKYVVKCEACGEATAFRKAPPGRKYVRCPCNCLLLCRVTSHRISCPRSDCKLLLDLVNPPEVVHPRPQIPGMSTVTCGNCHDSFMFNLLDNMLAVCPHCGKASSVGPDHAKFKFIVYIVLGLCILGIIIGITAGTASQAGDYPWLYPVYVVGFLLAAYLLRKAAYYGRIKISLIDIPAY